MAAIVANGICRFTVHGLFAGRPVANILDMKIDTTGSVVSRHDAIDRQGNFILGAWGEHVLDTIAVNNYVATKISWIDLDSLDGETGEKSVGGSQTWPRAGNGTISSMPGNVALRVNKRTNGGRGSKQGRMYLCGVAENWTSDEDPNLVSSANAAGVTEVMGQFLSDITIDAGTEEPLGDSSQLHVVHTKNGQFVNSTEVVALECDSTLASQRRRLR
jgi:hypothetical protein